MSTLYLSICMIKINFKAWFVLKENVIQWIELPEMCLLLLIQLSIHSVFNSEFVLLLTSGQMRSVC
jgi:hypothetical protein